MREINWSFYLLLRLQVELLQEHPIFLVVEVIDEIVGSELLRVNALQLLERDLLELVP
jgi:hypothetical protein